MSASRRTKLRIFLLAKEIVMTCLVLLSLLFLILEHLEQLSLAQLKAVDVYEVVVSILVLAEFLFEWHYARDRQKYLRGHWFYLIAAVPIPTATFEFLHGIRLLRLVKLFKLFAEYRYEHNTRLFSRR